MRSPVSSTHHEPLVVKRSGGGRGAKQKQESGALGLFLSLVLLAAAAGRNVPLASCGLVFILFHPQYRMMTMQQMDGFCR